MAEPITLFENNIPPDEGGGDGAAAGVKMPDWGKDIAGMAKSLASIQKTVADILTTTRAILSRLAAGSPLNAPKSPMQSGPAAPKVQEVFHVDPRKAIVPMRNMVDWTRFNGIPNWTRRPAGVANLSRFVDWSAIGAKAPADAGFIDVEAEVVSPGREKAKDGKPRVKPPPKPGAAPKGRRIGSFLGLGRTGSALLYAFNNLGLGGGMLGAVGAPVLSGLAAITATYTVGRMLINGSDSALRAQAMLSPTAASLQAQVDVSKMIGSISAANSPMVTSAAKIYADARLSTMPTMVGAKAIWDATLYTLGAGALGIFALSPAGILSTIVGNRLLQSNMANFASGGTNKLFHDDIDRMVGGMLTMQEAPASNGRHYRRYDVQWDKGRWSKRGHRY